MISKKLLEAVCPNTERYTYRIVFGNVEAIDHEWQGMIGTVNIYEVAHKCKEWASYKNIGLASYVEQYPDGACNLVWKQESIKKLFKAETEPEAIFKACEWILKQGEEDEL